jgi:DNA-binding response OmpR family regulator
MPVKSLTTMKILIVEDEIDLSSSIAFYLRQEKFNTEAVLNYSDALEKINLYYYDVVVVDITLPDGNGLELIRELKKNRSKSGIIIISAKHALDDKISGLEIGADDYLTKPFHLSELNARIKSLIRRRDFDGNNEIILDELRINPELNTVRVNDQFLNLTRKEYDLLIFFLANKNRVLSKESIAEHLWGDDIDMVDSYDFLYSHIKNLRKKIIEKGGKDYIQTVYGIGYKFATP